MVLKGNVPTAMGIMLNKTVETKKLNGLSKWKNLWLPTQMLVAFGMGNGGRLSKTQQTRHRISMIDQDKVLIMDW